ncbi:MAG: hypothetical protein ABFQ82_00970 [Thermodesulfobacteriota bacterium]
MKLKKKKKPASPTPKMVAQKNEQAMIEGILEGSPDGIGVAVVRLECGCRKMAAVDKEGEPASKVVIYRDSATEICAKCKEDDGAFSRVLEAFIHWTEPEPDQETKQNIEVKVLGNYPQA